MALLLHPAVLFVLNLVLQITAISGLAMSNGFTRLWPALLCLVAISASTWCMARLLVSGFNVGLLFPLVAAAVPLAAIVIGAVFLGEAVSAPKAALLVLACGLVGLASRF